MQFTDKQVEDVYLAQKNFCKIIEAYTEGIELGCQIVKGIKLKRKYCSLKDFFYGLSYIVNCLSLKGNYIFDEDISELSENTFYYLIGKYFEQVKQKLSEINIAILKNEFNDYEERIMQILNM